MTRFKLETRRVRGVTGEKERAAKTAGKAFAARFIAFFSRAMDGKKSEFVIEAANVIIRAMAKVVEARGDLGRAHGALGGAAAELTPAYRPGGHVSRAAADALFEKDAA